ncbi:alpha/beta fold hydrolase [Algihabitans albus]|uniref:alpha/beta fold hydrolase n=1 Tax=Algihabitans albus TaxID=2164067 RepID=UPI000E5D1C08|nr:alpha/beta fold hydrolase [Algihabitans albus]
MEAVRDQDPGRSSPYRTEPRRLGPRPLPLHLAMAGLAWSGWRLASLSSRPPWLGLPPASPPDLARRASDLERDSASAKPEALAAALQREAVRRAHRLLDGIEAYRQHVYRRDLPEPPVLWRAGTTRLLDYGACAEATVPDGPPILVVPSLINRAYILDLSARISLLRWLAAQGFRPLLVDWDAPGPIERGFSLTDYVAGRLEQALDAALAATGRRPLLAGYCMGGTLTAALAQRRQRDLAGLILLAAPWDFHGDQPQAAPLGLGSLLSFGPALDVLGELPVDAIQALFAAVDPLGGVRKFLAFAGLDHESGKAETFVALEDWLNDGVPLASSVARDCLGGWYGANTPALGAWRIAGRAVDPSKLGLPSLCMIPAQDRIVPPASARALGSAIPNCELREPAVGHIGMVTSGRARALVWEPLAAWMRTKAEAAA